MKNKLLIILYTAFSIVIFTATSYSATEIIQKALPGEDPNKVESPGTQTICPVMGGKIDKNLFVDIQGKRIYMCCLACEEGIKTEPDRYIRKIAQKKQIPAVLCK